MYRYAVPEKQTKKPERQMKPPQKHHSRKPLLAVALVLVGAAAVTGGLLLSGSRLPTAVVQAVVPHDPTFGSVTVAGISLKGMSMAQARSAVVAHLEKTDAARRYTLTCGNKSCTLAGSDLHLSYPINHTLALALSDSTGNNHAAKNYPLPPTIDRGTLSTRLKELTAPLAVAAKEPTIQSFDGSSFSFSEGTTGRKVDDSALLDAAVSLITTTDTGTVSVPVTEQPCKHTADDLRSHIIKLGSFTTVSTNTEDGTFNMTRALQAINGSVVPAGGTFSYLDVIGAAGEAEGYRKAGALEDGVAVQSYGGGICQGSTTLYGAVLRSGCAIVERSPHSSPSSYVPIGQDAAVSYPGLDFQLQNTTDYPMYIQSGADGSTMYCNLYGATDGTWDKIDVSSQQTGTVPAPADVTKVDSSKPAGYREQTVTPLIGRYASASRTFYKNGAAVRTEKLPNSYYPPRAAVYVVGSGGSSSKAASSAADHDN